MIAKTLIIRDYFLNLNLIEKILIFFPLFAILGALATNVFYFLLIIVFFYEIFKKRINLVIDKNLILILIIFYIIILNSYFLSEYKNSSSLIRTISVIKFFILPFIFVSAVKKIDFFFLLGIVSGVVTLFLTFDILFQYIFGFDIFGIEPKLENRYSGFLDEEHVAGSFLSFFSIYLIFFINRMPKNIIKLFIFLFLIILFLLAITITGERLALIRFVFIISLTLFFLKIKTSKKVFLILFVFSVLLTSYQFNQSFKYRFNELLFFSGVNVDVSYDKDLNKYTGANKLSNSPWASHWKVAYKIYNDNKLTGVGLKNFRVACNDEKYSVSSLIYNSSCTTHPHNIYFEILSELGIVGLLFFSFIILNLIITVFKSIFKSRKIEILIISSLIIFIFIPFLPSGSFFSSYYGGIIFYFISSYNALIKFNEFNK